jgi:hypothetical protein
MLFRRVFGFFSCVFPYLTEPLMPGLGVFVSFFKTRAPQQYPPSPSSPVASFLGRVGRQCMAHGQHAPRRFLSLDRACWPCSTFQVERGVYQVVVGSRMAFRAFSARAASGDGGVPGSCGSDLMFLFFRFCL